MLEMLSLEWTDSLIWLAATSESSILTRIAQNAWAILQVAIGLGFVIFVHELGHFLAAKFFGVKCEKFYIGFDVPIRLGPIRLPSSLARFQWGETEYGIGMIPLGGYVKMLGQDDDPRRAEQEAARIRQKSEEAGQEKVTLDPRSYPAKPVYARMIIISAGVIMNLIFAVLMAAYAFQIGVPYQPTIVGGLMPGDPAWESGIELNDQIVQVADMKKPNPKLQFMDMVGMVMMSGMDQKNRPIPIKLIRDEKEFEYSIIGTQRHDPDQLRTLLGIRAVNTASFAGKYPVHPMMLAESTETPYGIHAGDLVVAVDGQELAIDSTFGSANASEIFSILNSKLDEPVRLSMKRKEKEDKDFSKAQVVEVTVPPTPMHTLGLSFEVTGVTSIRSDSLAAKAGVKVGDQIVEFNGQAVLDGLTLRLQVLKQTGREVSLKLSRGSKKAPASDTKSNDETYEIRWTVPSRPLVYDIDVEQLAPAGYEIPGLGLVYGVGSMVTGVEAGSAAEKQGIQAGDVLKQIQVQPSEQQLALLEEFFKKESFKPRPIDNLYSSIWAHEFLQELPIGVPVRVNVERGGQMIDVSLQVAASKQWNWIDRGLTFEAAKLIHHAESLGEAFQLGTAETWKRMGEVFKFLKLLVTGKAPTKFLGGPGVIAWQASSAASEGLSKLLMFLVMLSANLAILNFLPVPALDGGHMFFLAAEAIRGKPVDEEFQARMTMLGVFMLLALMAFVIFNDVRNLSRIFGG